MRNDMLRPEVGRHGIAFKRAGVAVASGNATVSVFGYKNPLRPVLGRSATRYSVLVENCAGRPQEISGDKLEVLGMLQGADATKRFLAVCGILQVALALGDDTFIPHDSQYAVRCWQRTDARGRRPETKD